jgi:hypothetical protein
MGRGIFPVLAFLFLLPQARAACRIELGPRCTFTQASRLEIPDEAFQLRFSPGTTELDLGGIDRILETAEARPELDYTECLARLDGHSISRISTPPDSFDSCTVAAEGLMAAARAARAALRGRIARYSRQAYARGALPFREPAGTCNPPLPRRAREGMLRLLESCTDFVPRFALDLAVLSQLQARMFGRTPSCRQAVAKGYARLLLDAQLDAAQCVKFPAPCETRRRQVAVALSYLSAAGLTEPFMGPLQRELAANSCTITDWNLLNQSMSALFDYTRDALACRQPEVGESIPYQGRNAGGSVVSYLLTRTGAASYRATLNLNFVLPGTSPPVPVPPIARRALETRVRDCFRQVSGGPLGLGTARIDLALHDPAAREAGPAPPAHTVFVDESVPRMDSSTWRSDIPCSTLIHETLHILGLPDEYVETASGHRMRADGSVERVRTDAPEDSREYDCRAIGPRDSLMHYHTVAFDSYWPKELRSCVCPGTDGACIMAARAAGPGSSGCERGRLERQETATLPPGWRTAGRDVPAPGGNTRVYLDRPRPSLLYPAQFRAIVWPGCRDRNATYWACQRDSQRTSVARLGDGRCSVGKPAACVNGGVEWVQ